MWEISKLVLLQIPSELIQPLLILNINDPDKITAWHFWNFAILILTTLFHFSFTWDPIGVKIAIPSLTSLWIVLNICINNNYERTVFDLFLMFKILQN